MAILLSIIPICGTILSGLIAGSMMGTGLSLYSSCGLEETAWTQRFQLEDSLFARVMPPVSQAQLLCLVVATFLERDAHRILLAVATILSLVVLAITLVLEVPINKQIQSWTPGAAPAIWSAIRGRWLWNHLYRATAALLAFVLSTLAL